MLHVVTRLITFFLYNPYGLSLKGFFAVGMNLAIINYKYIQIIMKIERWRVIVFHRISRSIAFKS